MTEQHRNDIYGTADQPNQEETPAIPAATVVVLRAGEHGVETLMLHRTSKVHFGGMWVFPGGRIDPEAIPAMAMSTPPPIELPYEKLRRRPALKSQNKTLPGSLIGRHPQGHPDGTQLGFLPPS